MSEFHLLIQILSSIFGYLIQSILPVLLGYLAFIHGLRAYRKNKIYDLRLTNYSKIYRVSSVYEHNRPENNPSRNRVITINHIDDLSDLGIQKNGLKQWLEYELDKMDLYSDLQTSTSLSTFIHSPTKENLSLLKDAFRQELN